MATEWRTATERRRGRRSRGTRFMIRFWYRSVGPAGEVVEGMLDAPSKAALIEQLQDQGHVPIRAEEAGARAPGRTKENGLLGRPPLPRRRPALLTRELAALLHAGVP